MIIIATLIAGLCAVGGGVAGIVVLASRHPTRAQVAAAGQREFGVLWERLSAGQIFPASVSYLGSLAWQTTATRVGIAPQAPCGAAVDASAARVLAAAGCVTVLRATYADPSGTALATVGIAVMRSPDGATTVVRALASSGHGGLLPVSFPGTVAGLFTVRARETADVQSAAGPYVFLYAAGYADGRSTTVHPAPDSVGYQAETVTTDLGNGVAAGVAGAFQAPANPCADRNVQC
jgi:hypothetical protein